MKDLIGIVVCMYSALAVAIFMLGMTMHESNLKVAEKSRIMTYTGLKYPMKFGKYMSEPVKE